MDLFLGVEIGYTKQQLAIGTGDGTLLDVIQAKLVLKRGAQDILDWMMEQIPALLAGKPGYRTDVKAIGIGFGGPLETATGRVLSSIQVPGWEGFRLREWASQAFGLPCYVINDTVAGGYAELRLGAGRGVDHFFYTNIGSGIGGSLFMHGKWYDGTGLGASYLGNTFVPDWTTEQPGKPIRLELICSGMNIEKRLRRPGYVPGDSLMATLCDDPASYTCAMLAQAVRMQDAFAVAQLDAITQSFAIGLCNMLALAPARRIAIGGGVAKMGDILFDRIRHYTQAYAFIANKDAYDIVQSELLDNAVTAGAVLYAADHMVGSI